MLHLNSDFSIPDTQKLALPCKNKSIYFFIKQKSRPIHRIGLEIISLSTPLSACDTGTLNTLNEVSLAEQEQDNKGKDDHKSASISYRSIIKV